MKTLEILKTNPKVAELEDDRIYGMKELSDFLEVPYNSLRPYITVRARKIARDKVMSGKEFKDFINEISNKTVH